jgi:hypothetical protein
VNKKVLAVAVVLLSVTMVAIPLVQAYGFWCFDRRTKSEFTILYYDLIQVGEAEIKERNGITTKIANYTANLVVGGGAVAAGLIPAINPSGGNPYDRHATGTIELKVTKMYNPETGFGTIKNSGIMNFNGFDGTFETSSEGKCGGQFPALGLVSFFSAAEMSGKGRGDLRGASFKAAVAMQLNLDAWPNPAFNLLEEPKHFCIAGYGEISYYPPSD